MYQRLVLLGPPAAGKGTQAALLKERFGFQTPSVGAILREQKTARTPAGLAAAEYFDRGLLAPDEITVELVRQWIDNHEGPWAMDGFPRTLVQAQAFDVILRTRGTAADFALLINADDLVIKDRVSLRLMCTRCGAPLRAGFHVQGAFDPCPHCGGSLIRRADDNSAALSDRMNEYRTKTEPVIEYYRERGILHTIDGNRPIDAVFQDICAELEPPPAV